MAGFFGQPSYKECRMPHTCVVPADLLAAAGCVVGSKAAIKRILAQLNPADEKELATLRARIGAQEAPAEPDAEPRGTVPS
jgi:hypothetical protein